MAYKLTKEALLLDLYAAFHSAKRRKSSRLYVKTFEKGLDGRIRSLRDDLWNRQYNPEPSSCFIVEHPKKREVFAAQFRDRIVHHLYYNYTHLLFEKTFIHDTYSCIPDRGTHFGIERMKQHIRKESRNYTRKCYVLQLDKSGYFMHINRKKLFDITVQSLDKMSNHKVSNHGSALWKDVVDMDFLHWLSEKIIMLNPCGDCRIIGSWKDWDGLDRNKSLFFTGKDCGLPIGNLTSQLLSNVYLNSYDQYMKRTLGCRHYGRYVDDSYVVSCDKEWLMSLVPKVRSYLKENLGLDLHMGKLHIVDAKKGVEFLGSFIKRYTTYMSNESLNRSLRKIEEIDTSDRRKAWRSINSFLGVFRHFDSYNIRSRALLTPKLMKIGVYDKDITKMSFQHIINNLKQYNYESIWFEK